jgi:hypothetical protein
MGKLQNGISASDIVVKSVKIGQTGNNNVDYSLSQSQSSIKKTKKKTKKTKKGKKKKKALTSAMTMTEIKPIGVIETQLFNNDNKELIDLKYMVDSSEDEKQDQIEEIVTDEDEGEVVSKEIIMSNYKAYPCMMPMVNAG